MNRPGGLFELDESVSEATVHGLVRAYEAWDGEGVFALPYGVRFRQMRPDGTFEPFPSEALKVQVSGTTWIAMLFSMSAFILSAITLVVK